jgi:hypothetical protein
MLVNNLAITILGGLATTSALALPKNTFSIGSLSARKAGDQAVDQLLEIAPKSKSCDAANPKDQCRTAEQAAPFLIKAFQDYKIYNVHEIATILALLAVESGDFQYDKPIVPVAGKGTRSMMSAEFNFQYAKSIPALAPKVDAITKDATTAALSDDKKDSIRALVLPEEYSWGSAMWYLTTKCTADQRAAIQAGGPSGLAAHIACLDTTTSPDREAKFALANSAFGLS